MAERPNILYIITHDTGRHVGGYGTHARTPNLDRIGDAGVRLLNCFCTAPQCSPSRASVLTGQMPHTNGMYGLAHRGFRLTDDCPRLPRLLAQAGHRTHLCGMQHECRNDEVPGLGYETHDRGHNAEEAADSAVRFLEAKPQGPFFLSVGISQTHRKFSSSGDSPLDDMYVPPYLPDTPETRRDWADFNVDLQRVDQAVGRILDALEAQGMADDTLVVYTTDHGVAFPGAKGTLLDPGIGIASLWRGPGGFEGGRNLDALVSNIDYLPTWLDLAGLDVPEAVHGRSLLPLVRGEVADLHDEVFVELTYHAAYDPMRGVRTKTHKYIRSYEYRPYWFPPNVDDGYSKRLLADSWQFRDMRPRELLFDLQADPWERQNVAADPAQAAVLADLRARVDRQMDETYDPLRATVVAPPSGAEVTPPTNWGAELAPDR
jgi:arylsulfatase A-like enzyme